MTDNDLKQHVQSALDWEPRLDASGSQRTPARGPAFRLPVTEP